jgi:hypothetical protein
MVSRPFQRPRFAVVANNCFDLGFQFSRFNVVYYGLQIGAPTGSQDYEV